MTEQYIFHMIGCFFTDRYYYKLYNSAKRNSDNNSVTEGYRANLKEFCSCIRSIDKCYRRLVYDLYTYSKRSPTMSNSTYSEFVDKIVVHLVPDEYFENLSQNDKDGFLCKFITETTINLANFTIRVDILRKVIDQRDAQNKTITTKMIYEECMNILQTQKDIIIHSFICQINEPEEMVSIEILNSVRAEVIRVQDKYETLKEDYGSMYDDYEKTKADNAKLRRLIELLKRSHITISKSKEAANSISFNAIPDHMPLNAANLNHLNQTQSAPASILSRLADVEKVDREPVQQIGGGDDKEDQAINQVLGIPSQGIQRPQGDEPDEDDNVRDRIVDDASALVDFT